MRPEDLLPWRSTDPNVPTPPFARATQPNVIDQATTLPGRPSVTHPVLGDPLQAPQQLQPMGSWSTSGTVMNPDPESIWGQMRSVFHPIFGPTPTSADIASGRNITQSAPGFVFPARVGVDMSKDVPGRIVDMLQNSQFDPLVHSADTRITGSMYSAAPPQGSLGTLHEILGYEGGWRTSKPGYKAVPPIDQFFAPHEKQLARAYLEALDQWKIGMTPEIREALKSNADWVDPQMKNHADRLVELMNRSTSQTRGPLYRYSYGLGEFPIDPSIRYQQGSRALPKPGTTFYQYPVSYSATPQWPRRSNWSGGNTPLIMVEPGTRTLPVGGMLGFENQYEHVVGGHMQVVSATPKVIRLRQIDPTILPRPTGPLPPLPGKP